MGVAPDRKPRRQSGLRLVGVLVSHRGHSHARTPLKFVAHFITTGRPNHTTAATKLHVAARPACRGQQRENG
jgi:hypothetical protein